MELSDEEIDAIARQQDEPGEPAWFTAQITKLEWREYARAILAAHEAKKQQPDHLSADCVVCAPSGVPGTVEASDQTSNKPVTGAGT